MTTQRPPWEQPQQAASEAPARPQAPPPAAEPAFRPPPPSAAAQVAADDPLAGYAAGRYKPAYAVMVQKLAAIGATHIEMADFLSVSTSTLNYWRATIPEFAAACEVGTEQASDRVVRALYHRAIGYTHPEEKVHFDKDGEVHTYETRKHYAPDVAAATLWLTNKRAKQWSVKQTLQVEDPHLVSADDLMRMTFPNG